MSLSDVNTPAPAFDPVPPRFDAALAALPRLHAEANANFALARFLSRSPQASLILMLSGTAMLLAASAAGGGSLRANFAWSVLVLMGVIAMTRNFIRGFARSLRRVPLEEAASDLRALLLYTGGAWGAGAFLVMPTAPAASAAFSFVMGPAIAISLSLRDSRGIACFIWPAVLATSAAAIQGDWPYAPALVAALVAAGAGLASLAALQQKKDPA